MLWMKCLLIVVLSVSGWGLFAKPLLQLPSPSFWDTEVVTNLPLKAWNSEAREFNFSLAFNSTPSNNVELALGTDENDDGFLSSEETALIVGWDCGAWILVEPNFKRHTREEVSSVGRRTFSFQMFVSHKGVVKSLVVKDGSANILTNLTQKATCAALAPKDWNLVRLTARGMDAPDETVDFQYTPVGFAIILR